MMTKEEYDEIQARYKATTQGEWTVDEYSKILIWYGKMHIADIRGWGYLTGIGGLNLSDDKAIAIQEANAEFIAHSHQDIPALLADNAELESDRDYWKSRAEALEEFAKNNYYPCEPCVYSIGCSYPREDDDDGLLCENWQFDYDRYAKGAEQNG